MEKVKMSFVLKLKSLFYKYTGVFLAHKETNDYIDSDEYWDEFLRMLKSSDTNDMSPRNIHGLMMGMWQCHRGFARPMSFVKYNKPGFIFKPLGWFADLFTVIKWDFIELYRFFVPRKEVPQEIVKKEFRKRIGKKPAKLSKRKKVK